MAQFSAATSQLTLNGHVFTGLAEGDDVIKMPEIELARAKFGAQGHMQTHSTGIKGGEFMVKLQATAASNAFMQQQALIQQDGGAVQWNGVFRESDSGMSVRLENGTLTRYTPGGSVGAGSATDHTYTFSFERITPNYDGAKFPDSPQAS